MGTAQTIWENTKKLIKTPNWLGGSNKDQLGPNLGDLENVLVAMQTEIKKLDAEVKDIEVDAKIVVAWRKRYASIFRDSNPPANPNMKHDFHALSEGLTQVMKQTSFEVVSCANQLQGIEHRVSAIANLVK